MDMLTNEELDARLHSLGSIQGAREMMAPVVAQAREANALPDLLAVAKAVEWCAEQSATVSFFWTGPKTDRARVVNLYLPEADTNEDDEVDAPTLPAAVAALRERGKP